MNQPVVPLFLPHVASDHSQLMGLRRWRTVRRSRSGSGSGLGSGSGSSRVHRAAVRSTPAAERGVTTGPTLAASGAPCVGIR